MIILNNISKIYKKENKTIKILNDINYQFIDNKFYCIIGKSGAGKTTLIQILGLLLTYDGTMTIDNYKCEEINSNQKAEIRNKKIGFIFQSFYLNPIMKAFENVMLPCLLDKNLSYVDKKNKAIKLLNKVGLENRENHYPKELSGGEQQRVAIARAIINNPKIILADEPTGALDSETEESVLKLLKDLSMSGKCVIVVSHSKNVAKYADKILKLENGKLKEVNKNEYF